MKKDFSLELYQQYYRLTNRHIEITKKNGTVTIGVIIGYCKGEDDFITSWHVAAEACFEMDSFGNLNGEIIKQKDIQSVKFLEDNSILHCE